MDLLCCVTTPVTATATAAAAAKQAGAPGGIGCAGYGRCAKSWRGPSQADRCLGQSNAEKSPESGIQRQMWFIARARLNYARL